MKKNNLFIGVLYFLVGVACLIIGWLFETKLAGLLFGFAGGSICGGAVMLWKYYYWTRPENRTKYLEKTENENIELNDERKTKLRDKSGRYAYIIGLIVISVSIILFSILGSLDIIQNYRLIILYLGGLFVFQYIAGLVIYNHLSNKY
ncbi:hypothetical protein [Desulforamulus aeronauticus]|uniref:Uncharacterized protein n=1 Tax=Desulforamulus aeronauticus DSM 10349 TaxID=1121421 RepID=A0A1M6TBN6_9FIRM|nr:hypothetical protein [Desulforamulus aeronauticus]SHK54299.1 hypothetical protein SAMN02745123_02242 [Desulforamulus aeronauticus DSM 10349]